MDLDVKKRLIVALDLPTPEEALHTANELKGIVDYLKIGKQLFTAAGRDLVIKLQTEGFKIFLDMKFHDIPNTVGAASVEAAKLGVFMFNIHASGGFEMMKAAAQRVRDYAEKNGKAKPLIIGVTVLTSLGDEDLKQIGVKNDVHEQVELLSRLSRDAGLDGVVASAHEIKAIKKICGKDFIIVTPGIRPAGAAGDDQKRTMTAAEALNEGADYIVVGRPIIGAQDRATAVKTLLG
jgi:orotidine-5'-phosphate decarboxylase